MRMKTQHAELSNVKLTTVSKTREGGDVVGSEKYWVLTFRIPASAIDANELPAMAGEPIMLEFEPTQLAMDLEHKPARAPSGKQRRSGKEAAAGDPDPDADN